MNSKAVNFLSGLVIYYRLLIEGFLFVFRRLIVARDTSLGLYSFLELAEDLVLSFWLIFLRLENIFFLSIMTFDQEKSILNTTKVKYFQTRTTFSWD